MNELQLISLYYDICECYNTHLRWLCQRFSNNSTPAAFTDEELLTLYLFVMTDEEKHKVKAIWRYARKHLSSWFPTLPSYQAFNARLNRLADVFPALIEHFLQKAGPEGEKQHLLRVMDSLPVMLCSGKRKAKVARELSDKGYCSTKNLYYYGVKIHLVAIPRPGALPRPDLIGITPASCHDLAALRPMLPKLAGKALFGDKIYADRPLNEQLQLKQGAFIYTPVKLVKGQTQQERRRNKAADGLFSTAVSKVRQPVESFFNWLIEKSDIQRAAKVRSTAGLLVHTFGKIAAASYLLSLYP